MQSLGLDIGSSSVKACVYDVSNGKPVAAVSYPETELPITAKEVGWAEQDPELWWQAVVQACHLLRSREGVDFSAIRAVGIAYQMHGLVLLDKSLKPLRPAIIWCDSRAVACGENGAERVGERYCSEHLLNRPGNFTAAKLRWVQTHESECFNQVAFMMLPGDYIVTRLSGLATTTPSGLSEGILWDYKNHAPAWALLDAWEISRSVIPECVANVGADVPVSDQAALDLGLTPGIPISYRAGDQPNNAASLNVFRPGEIAATAGTSGVIYGVMEERRSDPLQRVNPFLHVDTTPTSERALGLLLCINGTGRLYAWLRALLAQTGVTPSYQTLNQLAAKESIGAQGLVCLPYGNGAERVLLNRTMGGQFLHLDFNRHDLGSLVRAAQEGIAFALNRGFDVLKSLGCRADVVRVGQGNLFESPVFAEAFVNAQQTPLAIYETDGAEGAARAAAWGAGFYASAEEAYASIVPLRTIEPNPNLVTEYHDAYHRWSDALATAMKEL